MLRFGRDQGGRPIVEGRVRAKVERICQRCLEACEESIDTQLLLGIVGSEAEAELLPSEYDPWLVSDRERTSTLIEDELILALPLLALHDKEIDCIPQEALSAGNGSIAETAQKRENPFAALADLKNRNHQD
ncbi:YceD family protein [Alkalilimnicola ehrlichii]|uniref:YceD family protein n=1 Tax=Alkalilimnicola ehrlichii TaxID=351052 RepID=UPI0015F27D43|nr:YceD family protein [Alkalilimnicola ehrlichii]